MGQTFGYFLSYVGFLALNAHGLASLGGFMAFWGVVFVASTLCVLAYYYYYYYYYLLSIRSDEHKPPLIMLT